MAHVIDAVLTLRDQFSGQLRNISQGLTDFQRRTKYVANDMRKVGKSTENIGKNLMAHVTAPLAGIGLMSLRASNKFTDAIAKVSTIADTTKVPIELLRKDIIKLSNDTGIASAEIADNVYDAISAGQKTGDAVNFARKSTTLAKAGFAEAGQSLDVLTTIMNAYKMKSEDVTKVSDMLITTQNEGKVTVGELSSVMGKVIPTAVATNTGLNQITAGYALMTKNGIKAAETTTYMNSMLNELSKTGSVADKALRKMSGKSFGQLMKEGKNVSDVLNILDNYAIKNKLSLKDMFGSAEAGKAALVLATGAGKDFNDMLKKMDNSSNATKDAYDKLQTPIEKFRKVLNEAHNSLLGFGGVLEPTMESLGDIIKTITDKISKLTPEQQEMIVKFGLIAASVGPVIFVIGKITTGISKTITGINKLSSSIKKAGGVMSWLTSPGHLVVIALIAIVTITALVIKNWDKICKTAKEVKEKLIELKNNALDKVKKGFETAKKKIEKFKETLKKSEPTIKSVAKVLGVIFAPALVSTGIKAVKAGARIAGSLIPKIIELGVNALITGTESLITLIGSIIKLGIEAVKTGAKITINLIGKLVDLGTQVIITAAKITGDLIIAIVSYAAKGWKAVGAIVAQTSAWIIQKGVVVAHTIKLIAHKAAVIGLTAVTKLLTAAQWALNAAFVATPVGWIVLAIGAIIGVAILLHKAWVKNWGGIQDKTQAVVDYVKGKIDSIKETFNSVKEKCAEFAQAIKETWGSIKEWMKHPIQGTISLIKNGDLSEVKGKNALGTPYWGGGLSVVGEHGPEIVEMPSGSKVHDNKDSRRMVGNGGSVTITFGDVHVRNESDIDAIANKIVQKLKIQSLNMA
ncbi:tail-tape measure protein (endogenous virus) [Clostridium phage phiCT453B]|uniref:tail length tape measure protein n=1 Tax=Clostridium phage phiCT453B TaxID=1567013 RepID=UPI0005133B47|nr:phage tail tape measure protein [Clostridium tetani]YP_009217941.1 tail length tape measure protein [Clostridium phage phiCT453B]AJA42597.1 tail-tape measure protein [Clostridium phage phiCT453B]KGI45316.1 hypothetical protein KY55_01405 [Clostridium tetani]